MIRFAGVTLSHPGQSSSAWAESHLSVESLFHAPSWPGRAAVHLDRPRECMPPKLELGKLYWPTGASRFAVGLYFTTTSDLQTIRNKVFGGSYTAEKLEIYEQSRLSISCDMFLLPPVPIAQVPGEEGLYLIPLVDDRYWWWDRSGVVEVTAGTTTWANLFASYGTILGVTLTHSAIPSTYLFPPTDLSCYQGQIPFWLDAAAASVGRRVVRRLDGSVILETPAEARATEQAEIRRSHSVHLGGTIALEQNAPGDWQGALPGTIRVAFPRYDDGAANASPKTTDVVLSTDRLNRNGLHTAEGNSEVRVLSSTAVAEYISSSWTNQTECENLAKEIARDHWDWLTASRDYDLAGTVPWVVTGRNDSVTWDNARSTRVRRASYQDLCDAHYHYTTSTTSPTPGSGGGPSITTLNVTNLNVLNTLNVSSTTTVNIAGPTINYTVDTTHNFSSNVDVTFTGDDTNILNFNGINVDFNAVDIDIDALSVFVINSYLEVCGYWAWCYYTHSAKTTNIAELDISLTATLKLVHRIPVNADINLSSIKTPSTTKAIQFATLNTGTNTLTLKHDDSGTGTSNYLLSLPNDEDVELPPGASALWLYDPEDNYNKLLSITGSSLNIDGLTEADVDEDDTIPFYDDSATTNRKVGVDRLGGWITKRADGRLTLSGSLPISSGESSATDLYYTPFLGNKIELYDGTRWVSHDFTELSVTLSGLTSGKNYDVIVYDDAGTLTLDLLPAWLGDTGRASGSQITYQDGVLVNASTNTTVINSDSVTANHGRVVGTIRASAANTTENTLTQRFVSNLYNKIPLRMVYSDSTFHSYGTASYRQWRGGTTHLFEAVFCEDQHLFLAVRASCIDPSSGSAVGVGVGVDSNTSPSVEVRHAAPYYIWITASEQANVVAGYHDFRMLERGNAGGTSPSFADGQICGMGWF